jgi:transcriptional regulator with XRE-family HTH domain
VLHILDTSWIAAAGRAARCRNADGKGSACRKEEFADMCGLDRTYVGGIERGERNVALVNIPKMGLYFESKTNMKTMMSTS